MAHLRILIIGINFSPELTGIGKYTGEMAASLARSGHQVCMITAPPYYPEWRISWPYKSWKYKVEWIEGVRVWRCPVWIPKTQSGTKRLLHLASFAISSLPLLIYKIFWRPDVVMAIEPPLFCAPNALLVAKISGSKAWLHIQDFELDAAFDLGLLTGQRIKNTALYLEKFLLKGFDVVSTISPGMLNKAKEKVSDDSKLKLLPNWVNVSLFRSESNCTSDQPIVTAAENLRRALGLSTNDVVALYSGNMGKKQGLEILASIARMAQTSAEAKESRINFVFCGDGSGREELVSACRGMSNVSFLDLQPLELLPGLLHMADIHLLPQKPEVTDLVMPSKLTGMLASGRPVVATALDSSELAQVVKKFGKVVRPGDVESFFQTILLLAKDQDLRARLGKDATAYASKSLDQSIILNQLETDLMALIRP